MSRPDNYQTQMRQAQKLFLGYDQQHLIRKFSLKADDRYLYTNMLCKLYRIDRTTGEFEKKVDGTWVDANTHGQVLTLLDLLCDSREDRFLTGRWKTTVAFGGQFHQNLMEQGGDPDAMRYDRDPGRLHRACKALGGEDFPGADIGYTVELFDGLRIGIKFWHSDEDFPAQLRFFWDENALQYIRYETMYYALGLLRRRLREME